jgi:hypothetical protein
MFTSTYPMPKQHQTMYHLMHRSPFAAIQTTFGDLPVVTKRALPQLVLWTKYYQPEIQLTINRIAFTTVGQKYMSQALYHPACIRFPYNALSMILPLVFNLSNNGITGLLVDRLGSDSKMGTDRPMVGGMHFETCVIHQLNSSLSRTFSGRVGKNRSVRITAIGQRT